MVPRHVLAILLILAKHVIGDEVDASNPDSNHTKLMNYRLPKSVVPNKYVISLYPNLTNPNNQTFGGDVEIHMRTVVDNVDKVTFHSKNLTYSSMKIMSVNEYGIAEETYILNRTVDEEKEFLTLFLIQPLRLNRTYVLEASYTGLLNDDMKGLYISSYKNLNNETVCIAATQHQATHARKTFPCFDEPSFKATYQLKITRSTKYNATLGNMDKMASTQIQHFVTEIFEETPRMSTYLLAFVITDFHSIKNNNEKFAVYARNTAVHQAEYAYSLGSPLLKYFTTYTTIDFPYKIDLVAIPDFSAGAMENWGLITYREDALLYDPKESTKRNKQRVATVVAHELSHMWFGDLVTLEWWDYAWLNEGFARFFQYKAIANLEPLWEMENQFVIDQQQTIFEMDSLLTANPLTRQVFTPIEISTVFDPITYSKGASVIRMLEYCLGKETFRAGLTYYLQKNMYNNTKPEQLYEALQQQAVKDNVKINVSDMMSTWTEKNGYPYINVVWTGSNEEVFVSQNRFLFNGKELKKTYWNIPLTYTYEGNRNLVNTTPQYWLTSTGNNVTFKIPGTGNKWILFNPQGTGYYRVNYCKTLWNRLINYLKKAANLDGIAKIDRAQTVDNVLNLARAGIVNYTIAFELLDYMKQETDYFPWAAAFNGISFINTRFEGDAIALPLFQGHVKMLMKNLYKKYGFEESSNDTHIETFNRINSVHWACQFEDADCVSKSKKMFDKWMTSNESVTPNFKSVVYCTALRTEETNRWNYLWNQYLNTNVPSEQATILVALGCSKNENILNGYLNKSIDQGSGLRKQDSHLVFSSVYSGSPLGVQIAIKFLMKNYIKMSESYGGINGLAGCINGLATHLTTKQQIEEFETFLNSIKNEIPEIVVSSTTAVESAKSDLKWNEQYRDVIVSLLKTKKNGGFSTRGNRMLVAVFIILNIFNRLL